MFHSPQLVALLQSSPFSFLNLHLDLGTAGGWAGVDINADR